MGVYSDNFFKTNIIVADFLLAMQTKTGNFPCAMDEAPPNPTRHENEELVHWCHGAPGISIFTKKNSLYFLEFLIYEKKLCRYDLYVGQGLFGMERRKIFDRSIELWRMCLEERTVEERYFILHYYDYFFREINLMNFF